MYASTELRQTEHLSQLTQADIFDAANDAYAAVAEEHGCLAGEVHLTLCRPVSKAMVQYMGERGHEASRVPRSRPVYHFYVDLASERTDERVLVDPTWQQFLARGLIRPEMPRVLMGTGDEIVATARSYGMEDRMLDLYRPVVPFN